MTQARKRLLVPIYAASGPEMSMPIGIAAVARVLRTEFTLPCICMGTTVCSMVNNETLKTGAAKVPMKAPIAMIQNIPVGVRATIETPKKMTYTQAVPITIFLLNPFVIAINIPPPKDPAPKNAVIKAKSSAPPR
jgi:hypothetical protein